MEDGDVALGFLPKDRSMFGRGCEMPGPRYSGCSHLDLGAGIPPMLSCAARQMPMVEPGARGGSAAPNLAWLGNTSGLSRKCCLFSYIFGHHHWLSKELVRMEGGRFCSFKGINKSVEARKSRAVCCKGALPGPFPARGKVLLG